MRRHAVSMWILSTMLVLAAGCARTFSYHTVVADLKASGSSSVAVAAHDQRPYVKNGDKKPEYVGDVRSDVGIPYGYWTESGLPLAEDISAVVCNSLKAKGFQCTPVVLSPQETEAQALQKLHAAGSDRLILLTVAEWKTDTYMATNNLYDLTLKVMSRDGKMLAQASAKGSNALGTSVFNPAGVAAEEAPKALKGKLEALLNDPKVAKALP